MKRTIICLILLAALTASLAGGCASNSPEDRIGKGVALSVSGLCEDAVEEFTWVIQHDPDPEQAFRAYAGRGECLCELGLPDQGIEDCYAALEAYPQTMRAAYVFFTLGSCFNQKGELDKAILAYSEAIDLAYPRVDPAAYYNRSLSYEYKGLIVNAIDDMKEYVRLEPDDPQGLERLQYLEDRIRVD